MFKFATLFTVLTCVFGTTLAQTSGVHLRVGVTHAPPYAIEDEEGNWTGMSVELWRHIAEADRTAFELVKLDKGKDLLSALESGTIDVALTADLSYRQTGTAAFLQHHRLTTLGVALPKRTSFVSIAKALFTKQFLYLVLSLSALLLLVGTVIYFIEREENEDQFGGKRSLLEGIGSGFWWAGVTMTTIGYGDKAPASLGGRIVAMLWMLLAMAISASLTAGIVSAANSKQEVSFPEDLKKMKVATVEGSPAAEFLKKRDYQFTTYKTATAALEAMENKKIEAVVADANRLNYQLSQNTSLTANVETTKEGPVAYALMVRQNGDLADRFDAHLVKFILSPSWRKIVDNYSGK